MSASSSKFYGEAFNLKIIIIFVRPLVVLGNLDHSLFRIYFIVNITRVLVLGDLHPT
jgi:hypothetical protein